MGGVRGGPGALESALFLTAALKHASEVTVSQAMSGAGLASACLQSSSIYKDPQDAQPCVPWS